MPGGQISGKGGRGNSTIAHSLPPIDTHF